VRGREALAAKKDPCSSAQLMKPVGLPSNGMCNYARSIAGLYRVGSGKYQAKQVSERGENRLARLTLCVHGQLSDHAGRVAYPGHPQDKETALRINVIGSDCFSVVYAYIANAHWLR
jgi:hypothetical protein